MKDNEYSNDNNVSEFDKENNLIHMEARLSEYFDAVEELMNDIIKGNE